MILKFIDDRALFQQITKLRRINRKLQAAMGSKQKHGSSLQKIIAWSSIRRGVEKFN